ncbi:MAG: glycosyltransferase family 2 protein [Alphaproteobacteria bacterium]
MNAPLFSVIIPAHNRAHVLGNAIRSVRAQTCQDFEIIVVDDGSADDPCSVAQSFGDARIRVIRRPHQGAGAARNTGIEMAHGRYVAFLDSDDEFLPRHLEAMKGMLAGRPNTVGYARIIVDRGQGRTFLKPPRAIRPGEHMATYLFCDRGFVPTITLALEAEVARRVKYDPGLRFGDDKDFALRLHLAGCDFVMAERPGAIWHDVYDPARASSGRKAQGLAQWLERLPEGVPARAVHGCRGWVIAKSIAPHDPLGALRLYLSAVLRGCYRPRLALIILLQIFLPDRLYRRLADAVVSILAAGKSAQPAS